MPALLFLLPFLGILVYTPQKHQTPKYVVKIHSILAIPVILWCGMAIPEGVTLRVKVLKELSLTIDSDQSSELIAQLPEENIQIRGRLYVTSGTGIGDILVKIWYYGVQFKQQLKQIVYLKTPKVSEWLTLKSSIKAGQTLLIRNADDVIRSVIRLERGDVTTFQLYQQEESTNHYFKRWLKYVLQLNHGAKQVQENLGEPRELPEHA